MSSIRTPVGFSPFRQTKFVSSRAIIRGMIRDLQNIYHCDRKSAFQILNKAFNYEQKTILPY